MNKFMYNINFKKVIIIYIVLFVIFLGFVMIFLGNKYYDKLNYLYNYYKVSELVEKKYSQSDMKMLLSKLSDESNDVVDIVIINSGRVTYSTTGEYKNDLTMVGNDNYFYKDSNNYVYKLDSKDDFIFSLFSINRDDDYYSEFNINSVDYTITYLKSDNTNDKIVFVNRINEVENGVLCLKVVLVILFLFFMLYWIITSLVVYQNAKFTKLNFYFWGVLVLFTNIIGVVIYLIYINNRVVCSKCNMSNCKDNVYCISCGNKINSCCKKCYSIIGKNDKYCKSCGKKV